MIPSPTYLAPVVASATSPTLPSLVISIAPPEPVGAAPYASTPYNSKIGSLDLIVLIVTSLGSVSPSLRTYCVPASFSLNFPFVVSVILVSASPAVTAFAASIL